MASSERQVSDGVLEHRRERTRTYKMYVMKRIEEDSKRNGLRTMSPYNASSFYKLGHAGKLGI
jgi:hypothetical protein